MDKNNILKHFTILCVEDEPDVIEELAQMLGRRAKKLILASNGEEGLEKFKEHTPDIVITDVLMPVMNGFDMTRAIKLINPDVPVIVTTAFNEPDFFLRAIEIGISKYVLKPVNVQAFLETVNEVAWLLRAQRELRLSATVFNASAEAILITDEENKIIAVNPAFTAITGYTHEDVMGKNPKLLNSGRQDKAFYQKMWETLKREHRWQGEIWNRRKDGEIYPEWLTLSLVTDENEVPLYHVALFSDISLRKANEQKLYHLAHYDPLTNLPNRTLLQDRLHQAVGQAARGEKALALLFIDLDRFKYVNDTFGHLIGDLLLQEVSRRLKTTVRTSDTVARLGGDEFVILLPQISDHDGAAKVAKQILTQLTTPFELNGNEVQIGGSIGIALYPENGDSVEMLMKAADSAMYAVKESGRNSFQFFHTELNERLNEKIAMENAFMAALNNGEFVLHYQPMFDSQRKISGVEALVRWKRPGSSDLRMPSEFLPVAEESDFILPLGKWVLRHAMEEVKSLQVRTNHPDLKLAVNISAKQLAAHGFAEFVRATLKDVNFEPSCLELEISEKVLVSATESIFFALGHLRDLGISVVVDDFGMGYATLLHLSSLPIERLKVDSSILETRNIKDEEKLSVIYAIIAMADSLSLKITMGGLENVRHENLIEGCNFDLQGFHFCQPLNAEALESELKK